MFHDWTPLSQNLSQLCMSSCTFASQHPRMDRGCCAKPDQHFNIRVQEDYDCSRPWSSQVATSNADPRLEIQFRHRILPPMPAEHASSLRELTARKSVRGATGSTGTGRFQGGTDSQAWAMPRRVGSLRPVGPDACSINFVFLTPTKDRGSYAAQILYSFPSHNVKAAVGSLPACGSN